MNSNKEKVLGAVWNNPEILFDGEYFKHRVNRRDAKTFSLTRTDTGNIYIHFNHGHELSGQKSFDILEYAGQYRFNTVGFYDTLKALAEKYGITLQYSEQEKKEIAIRKILPDIAAILKVSLSNNPNGAAAKYLTEQRGFKNDGVHFGELTEESIKKAKGDLAAKNIQVSEEQLKALHLTKYNADRGFNLVIPIYFNGEIVNLKYRNVKPSEYLQQNNISKYDMASDLPRIGYCEKIDMTGKGGTGTAIFVEGELDAIRLTQSGCKNVIAFGGAGNGERISELLESRKITTVNYVIDTEYKEGKKRISIAQEEIKKIQAIKGIKSVLITDFPAQNNGTDIKLDADTYGKEYGAAALKKAVDSAIFSWKWELNNLMKWAENSEGSTDTEAQLEYLQFQERFFDIYNRENNEFQRELIRQYVESNEFAQVFKSLGITVQSLLDIEDFRRNKEYNNRLKELQGKLNKAVETGGNPSTIGDIITQLNELKATDTREEWNTQLNRSFEDKLTDIVNQPETLKTKWKVGTITPEQEFIKYADIEFYPADIEIIAAQSSHGKTAFLFQAIFDLLRQYPDKTYLYVSCEENERQLLQRALNVYTDIETTPDGKAANGDYCFKTGTRRKTILSVIRGQRLPVEYTALTIQETAEANAHSEYITNAVKSAIKDYQNKIDNRLKFIHTESSAESITANILTTVEDMRNRGVEVGGVFVDYIQLLTTDGKNYSRHDELKAICKALKGCAAQTELPFVIAAQLNREALRNGIDDITLANLGEAADIERIAHDVYFLWQVDKTNKGMYQKPAKENEFVWDFTKCGERSNRIFTYYQEGNDNIARRNLKEGYLYIEQLKARDGKTGGWALLPFDGERGKIGETDINKMKE